MNFLENKILEFGTVKEGNVLKVDSFLNHQIDIELLRKMAHEWQRRYNGTKITKVLTIEASGIAIATMVASTLNVPLVFAKKSKTSNLSDDLYFSNVKSYTHNTVNTVFVDKKYLSSLDHILIIDDFLAHGEALSGLIDLVNQAGATLAGAGIAIEKGFQDGGKKLREKGYRIESLAIIESMDDKSGEICFKSEK